MVIAETVALSIGLASGTRVHEPPSLETNWTGRPWSLAMAMLVPWSVATSTSTAEPTVEAVASRRHASVRTQIPPVRHLFSRTSQPIATVVCPSPATPVRRTLSRLESSASTVQSVPVALSQITPPRWSSPTATTPRGVTAASWNAGLDRCRHPIDAFASGTGRRPALIRPWAAAVVRRPRIRRAVVGRSAVAGTVTRGPIR